MVIKSKSVEFMPFFLSFFLFLNGGVWSLYSVLVKDYYIAVSLAFSISVNLLHHFYFQCNSQILWAKFLLG